MRSTIKRCVPKWLIQRIRGSLNHLKDTGRHIQTFLKHLVKGEPFFCKQLRLTSATMGNEDGQWNTHLDSLSSSPVVLSFGVGTNIAWDLALIQSKNATVHAFDPTPIACSWLAQQFLPRNFHFHEVGIASFDGYAQFELPSNHGVSFVMHEVENAKQSINCQVRKLSTICQDLHLKHIDILKLDIEGAEYDIIADIINSDIPIDQLLIEFHHRLFPLDGNSKTNRAILALQNGGFQIFFRSSRGLEYSFIHKRILSGTR